MKITITKENEVLKEKRNELKLRNTFSSLKTCIDIRYLELVKVFGKPNVRADKYKTDAEWHIITPSGIATIYNYKTGKSYLGKEGLIITKITDWHIGGENMKCAMYILNVLNLINK